MPNFSDMLKYFRKRANLTQQELADKVGLTRSRINNYEQGVREPDFETTELFADFFNVDLDTLMARTNSNIYEGFHSNSDKMSKDVSSVEHLDYLRSLLLSNNTENIPKYLNLLSNEQLDDLFIQLISGKDKDYLVCLASKILEIASRK